MQPPPSRSWLSDFLERNFKLPRLMCYGTLPPSESLVLHALGLVHGHPTYFVEKSDQFIIVKLIEKLNARTTFKCIKTVVKRVCIDIGHLAMLMKKYEAFDIEKQICPSGQWAYASTKGEALSLECGVSHATVLSLAENYYKKVFPEDVPLSVWVDPEQMAGLLMTARKFSGGNMETETDLVSLFTTMAYTLAYVDPENELKAALIYSVAGKNFMKVKLVFYFSKKSHNMIFFDSVFQRLRSNKA